MFSGRQLVEYVSGKIWIRDHSLSYWGAKYQTRMTIIRLDSGDLFVHSPVAIDEALETEIKQLGTVKYIVAPNKLHYFFVNHFHQKFPEATVYLAPGLREKMPQITCHKVLGNESEAEWAGEIDQHHVKGNTYLEEVVFFHRATKTLILTDFIEHLAERTVGLNWITKLWSWFVGTWNKATPCPEYAWYSEDASALKCSVESIAEWDAGTAILSHGELIQSNVNGTLLTAYNEMFARQQRSWFSWFQGRASTTEDVSDNSAHSPSNRH